MSFYWQVWKSNRWLWNEYRCNCNWAYSLTYGGPWESHSCACWFCLQTASSLSIHGWWDLDLPCSALAKYPEVRKVLSLMLQFISYNVNPCCDQKYLFVGSLCNKFLFCKFLLLCPLVLPSNSFFSLLSWEMPCWLKTLQARPIGNVWRPI